MRKTTFKTLAFLTTLSVCVLSVPVYAAPDARDDRVCVDQEILHSFENKFILLEQEKEALREKLSNCVVEQSAAEKQLPVRMSQKDGQRMRYLEERVKELEKTNILLKEKLAAFEGVDPEDLAGDFETYKELDGTNLFDAPEDISDGGSIPDDATAFVNELGRSDGSVVPEQTETQSTETADSAEDDNGIIRPPSLPNIKMAKLDIPQDSVKQDSQMKTSGSSSTSVQGTPLLLQPESYHLADVCMSHFKLLKRQALENVPSDVDQATVQELIARYSWLVVKSAAGVDGDATQKCEEDEFGIEASNRFASITEELAMAETSQRKIQILYQAVRKQEALALQNLN